MKSKFVSGASEIITHSVPDDKFPVSLIVNGLDLTAYLPLYNCAILDSIYTELSREGNTKGLVEKLERYKILKSKPPRNYVPFSDGRLIASSLKNWYVYRKKLDALIDIDMPKTIERAMFQGGINQFNVDFSYIFDCTLDDSLALTAASLLMPMNINDIIDNIYFPNVVASKPDDIDLPLPAILINIRIALLEVLNAKMVRVKITNSSELKLFDLALDFDRLAADALLGGCFKTTGTSPLKRFLAGKINAKQLTEARFKEYKSRLSDCTATEIYLKYGYIKGIKEYIEFIKSKKLFGLFDDMDEASRNYLGIIHDEMLESYADGKMEGKDYFLYNMYDTVEKVKQEEIDNFERKLAKYKKRIDELTKRIEDMSAYEKELKAKTKLVNDSKKTADENDRLKQKVEKLNGEIHDLKKQLGDKKKENSDLIKDTRLLDRYIEIFGDIREFETKDDIEAEKAEEETTATIEEMVETIKDFKIAIVSYDPHITEKCNNYGLNNITLITEVNCGEMNGTYDIMTMMTSNISHKLYYRAMVNARKTGAIVIRTDKSNIEDLIKKIYLSLV